MIRLKQSFIDESIKLMDAGEKVELTTDINKAIQFLIYQLLKRKIPYKIHQLGAGVKMITTDTETCPCCKRKLK